MGKNGQEASKLDKLLEAFPLSASVRPGDGRGLTMALVIYVLAWAIASIVAVVVGWIPLVGALVRAAQILLGLYCLAGAALAVAGFFRGQSGDAS